MTKKRKTDKLTNRQRRAVAAATPKTYLVTVEYSVRGTVCVFATNEGEAREAAHDEMVCQGTCEIFDWEIASVREDD